MGARGRRKGTPGDGDASDAFGITRGELVNLMSYRGCAGQSAVTKLGGPEALHIALDSPAACGIIGDPCDIHRRQCYFGVNEVPRGKPRHFCRIFLCALLNIFFILLLLLALILLILGLVLYFWAGDWNVACFALVLGFALIFNILFGAFWLALINRHKERQFHRLQCLIDAQYHAIVIRNGAKHEIESRNVVVGDLYYISHGMILPADGILIEANDLELDESCLTGEGRCAKKCPGQDVMCYAGTACIQGNGVVLTTAVGECTQAGAFLLFSRRRRAFCRMTKRSGKDLECPSPEGCHPDHVYYDYDEGQSILQRKLHRLAVIMGIIGMIVALFIVIYLIVVLVVWRVVTQTYWRWRDAIRILYILATGLALLIAAIPEGLPLVVTLAVAYAVIKMAKDCVLVRNLHAVENVGNISVLFVDKSGLLTSNRMSVVGLYIQGCYYTTLNQVDISPRTLKMLCKGIAVNSSYNSTLGVSMDCTGSLLMTGNKTECALLGLVHRLGVDYQEIRDLHPECGFTYVYPFTPDSRMMSTIVPTSWGGFRMFTKGSPESVLARTSFVMMADGEEKPFDEAARCATNDVLRNMACNGLRAIALATRRFDCCRDWCDECKTVRHLTLVAIASIDDPLRCDVSDCAKRLACAGIQVKLLTGENLLTAQTVSHRAGIYDPSDPNQLAVSCKDWNQALCHKGTGNMDLDALAAAAPRLRVLARCNPVDKFKIIRGLIHMEEECCGRGDIIAVTGNSLYDAPALKIADVGFATSSGTDVAKEAADIILLDDSFCSILKAVGWGRAVYDNVSKFLQFHMTMNIVLLTIMLVIVLIGHWTPFTPMQLLWINLIMDVFAAVALATDPPSKRLLNRCPYKRHRSILSRVMKVNIFGQALFQIIVLLLAWFFTFGLLGPFYYSPEEVQSRVYNKDDSIDNEFADFPFGVVSVMPVVYPWSPEIARFPNETEPWPYQAEALEYDQTNQTESKEDPFWVSFWPFLGFDPNAYGCVPYYWYSQCMTFVFNLFVIMSLFNLLNARKIHGERNKLSGVTKNRWFIAVWFFILFMQIMFVESGWDVMGTRPLTWGLWTLSFFYGLMVLVWQQILDTIVRVSRCYDSDEEPHFKWGLCCKDHMPNAEYDSCYTSKACSKGGSTSVSEKCCSNRCQGSSEQYFPPPRSLKPCPPPCPPSCPPPCLPPCQPTQSAILPFPPSCLPPCPEPCPPPPPPCQPPSTPSTPLCRPQPPNSPSAKRMNSRSSKSRTSTGVVPQSCCAVPKSALRSRRCEEDNGAVPRASGEIPVMEQLTPPRYQPSATTAGAVQSGVSGLINDTAPTASPSRKTTPSFPRHRSDDAGEPADMSPDFGVAGGASPAVPKESEVPPEQKPSKKRSSRVRTDGGQEIIEGDGEQAKSRRQPERRHRTKSRREEHKPTANEETIRRSDAGSDGNTLKGILRSASGANPSLNDYAYGSVKKVDVTGEIVVEKVGQGEEKTLSCTGTAKTLTLSRTAKLAAAGVDVKDQERRGASAAGCDYSYASKAPYEQLVSSVAKKPLEDEQKSPEVARHEKRWQEKNRGERRAEKASDAPGELKKRDAGAEHKTSNEIREQKVRSAIGDKAADKGQGVEEHWLKIWILGKSGAGRRPGWPGLGALPDLLVAGRRTGEAKVLPSDKKPGSSISAESPQDTTQPTIPSSSTATYVGSYVLKEPKPMMTTSSAGVDIGENNSCQPDGADHCRVDDASIAIGRRRRSTTKIKSTSLMSKQSTSEQLAEASYQPVNVSTQKEVDFSLGWSIPGRILDQVHGMIDRMVHPEDFSPCEDLFPSLPYADTMERMWDACCGGSETGAVDSPLPGSLQSSEQPSRTKVKLEQTAEANKKLRRRRSASRKNGADEIPSAVMPGNSSGEAKPPQNHRETRSACRRSRHSSKKNDTAM